MGMKSRAERPVGVSAVEDAASDEVRYVLVTFRPGRAGDVATPLPPELGPAVAAGDVGLGEGAVLFAVSSEQRRSIRGPVLALA